MIGAATTAARDGRAPHDGRAARRRRSGSGYTLVEVLMSVGLSSVIAVPLLGWALLAVQQQPRADASLTRTNGAALLGNAFARDVPAAVRVELAGSDCIGGESAGGVVAVALVSGGVDPTRTTYVEKASQDPVSGDPESSLWRRRCTLGGALLSEDELVHQVRPTSTSGGCETPAGSDPCRIVELSYETVRDDEPVRLRAQRRAGVEWVPTGATGNRSPRARITVDVQSGNQPLVVSFSGATSTDPDGTIVSWDWEFPGGNQRSGVEQSWTFPTAGEFPAVLTVTDDDGATHSTFVTISVANRPPIAFATATPSSGDLSTAFTFSAGSPPASCLPDVTPTGSCDPDGTIVSYRWEFGGGVVETTESPQISHTFPIGSTLGGRDVVLVVTDNQGATDTTTVRVTLRGRPPTAAITLQPAPVGGVVGTVGPGKDLVVTFQSTGTDPDGGPLKAWSWTLRRAGSPTVEWTSTLEQPSLSFAALGPGVYEISLTVVDADDEPSPTPAVLQFTVMPAKPPAPTWGGSGNWVVSWAAVPNAQGYSLEITRNTFCASGDVVATFPIPAGPAPSYTITDGCIWGGWYYRARYRVTVNGLTSEYSDARNRP